MRLITTLTALLVVWLAVLLALRTPFRCDLYVWSESPFMTDMLKLTGGHALYGPPADVNSFVYAPGLQYLTFALLAPFGLALDVRWCRVVNVLVGVGAAAAAAGVTMGVVRAIRSGAGGARAFLLGFGVATLLVFANYTSDVPHPDNLHMLHAALTLLLCLAALRRASFPLASTAMLVAGLGVLAKQPAVLTAVGAGATLLLGCRWGRGRSLALLAIGAVSTAIALIPELATPDARFFTLGLPSRHGIDMMKLVTLAADVGRGHRLLLTALVVPSLLQLARWGGAEGRRFVLAWACLGATTAAPALLAYLKIEGAWNNLAIAMLWFWIPCWVVLAGEGLPGPAGHAFGTPALRKALIVVLLLTLVPTRLPPSHEAVAYCDALVEAVGRDLRAGRRVLLDHGTTPFIANGVTTVPLDRGNTVLELTVGQEGSRLAAMQERVATWQYDRIYSGGGWYWPIGGILQRYYRATDEIPSPKPTPLAVALPFDWGATFWSTYTRGIKVYEPTDDLTVHEPGPVGARQLAERARSVARRRAAAAAQP